MTRPLKEETIKALIPKTLPIVQWKLLETITKNTEPTFHRSLFKGRLNKIEKKDFDGAMSALIEKRYLTRHPNKEWGLTKLGIAIFVAGRDGKIDLQKKRVYHRQTDSKETLPRRAPNVSKHGEVPPRMTVKNAEVLIAIYEIGPNNVITREVMQGLKGTGYCKNIEKMIWEFINSKLWIERDKKDRLLFNLTPLGIQTAEFLLAGEIDIYVHGSGFVPVKLSTLKRVHIGLRVEPPLQPVKQELETVPVADELHNATKVMAQLFQSYSNKDDFLLTLYNQIGMELKFPPRELNQLVEET